MNEYLLRHAIDTIWCNPDQDRQHVYKLARLTPLLGVTGSYSVNYERMSLPTAKERYHLYQVGKIVPILLGLPRKFREWIPLSSLATNDLVLTEIYNEAGIQFPRFETYVRIEADRNLVFAVRFNATVSDLDADTLYCRFYSNAYFSSERSNKANKRYILHDGLRVTTTAALLQFQIRLKATLAEKGGFPMYYVNGRFVQEISLVNAQVGDVVEYIIDGSVTGFREFKVSTQPTFTSTLDKERKYILHYDDKSVQSIRFFDDLDVFLYKPQAVAGRFSGVIYHRNKGSWLRMLTHKDYSVSIPRLQTFVATHPTDPRYNTDPVRWPQDRWNSLEDLTMRIYFRNSGYDRPLQAEANRINELYKLTSPQIINAMTGNLATNPLWQAANLEQCPYVKFMSMPAKFVYPLTFFNPDETSAGKEQAQQFAGDVFGYHAAAQILAKTPSLVYTQSGNRYANMAYEHWYDATVFEYDVDGKLLGYSYHTAGRQYRVINLAAVRVEAITGQGGDRMHTAFGVKPVSIPTGYNYRIYVSSVWGGQRQGDWKDLTDLPELAQYGYLDETGEVRRWVWTVKDTEWYGAVRIDDRFLLDELSFTKTAGLIQFSFAGVEVHDTEEAYTVMEIPAGQVDLFIKDTTGKYRPLIENLDFTVSWPRVVVNNLEYLAEGVQQILIRVYGFCDDQFNTQPATEVGFVKYGVISDNGQYNVHANKIRRVLIDGHYRDPSTLVYEEQLNGLTITNERNGAPFVIQTPPIRFKDVYVSDAKARREDDARDQQVIDYMNQHYPVRKRPGPDTITRQYHVFSPFANKVLTDLLSGRLNPAGLSGQYSEVDIRKWMTSYEWLAAMDICNRGYNETHVQVLPHWFGVEQGLPVQKYDFYVRVLALYLRNRPDVSPFVFVVR